MQRIPCALWRRRWCALKSFASSIWCCAFRINPSRSNAESKDLTATGMGNSILQAYRQYLCLSPQCKNTFPSDHSSMSSRGSFARYMFVVFHHSGIPRNMTAYLLIQHQKPVSYPECKDDISPSYGLCCGQWRWSHRGRNGTWRSVEIKHHEISIWAGHCWE